MGQSKKYGERLLKRMTVYIQAKPYAQTKWESDSLQAGIDAIITLLLYARGVKVVPKMDTPVDSKMGSFQEIAVAMNEFRTAEKAFQKIKRRESLKNHQ